MQRKQARKDSQDALRQPLLDGDEPETRADTLRAIPGHFTVITKTVRTRETRSKDCAM